MISKPFIFLMGETRVEANGLVPLIAQVHNRQFDCYGSPRVTSSTQAQLIISIEDELRSIMNSHFSLNTLFSVFLLVWYSYIYVAYVDADVLCKILQLE